MFDKHELVFWWEVLKLAAFVAWLPFPFMVRFFLKKYPWFFPTFISIRRPLSGGMEGARELERLIHILGRAQMWLHSADETELIKKVRKDLWQVLMNLSTQSVSYIAALSPDTAERCAAIRRLSQIVSENTYTIMEGIVVNACNLNVVRDVAREARDEIGNRLGKTADRAISRLS